MTQLRAVLFDGRNQIIAAAVVAAALVSMSLTQDLMIYQWGLISESQKLAIIDLDAEQAIPSWYASALLLIAAVQLHRLARDAQGERPCLAWLSLSGLFILVSADESVGVHERLILPLRAALGADGLFYFAWVIPAIAACAIGLWLYAPLIRSLPGPVRRLFVLSAAMYLGGAIGMEMLGGAVYEARGPSNLTYRLLMTVEESLELGGVLVFLTALNAYRARLPAAAPGLVERAAQTRPKPQDAAMPVLR